MKRQKPSSANSRNRSLLALALLLVGCAPSVQDCHSILPIVSEPVTVTTTPAGTAGCACMADGVLVVAEARRAGFSWSRGQLWVDGSPVSEQDFPSRLAQVKAQRQIDAAAAQLKGAAQGVADHVRRAGKALTDFLRR